MKNNFHFIIGILLAFVINTVSASDHQDDRSFEASKRLVQSSQSDEDSAEKPLPPFPSLIKDDVKAVMPFKPFVMKTGLDKAFIPSEENETLDFTQAIKAGAREVTKKTTHDFYNNIFAESELRQKLPSCIFTNIPPQYINEIQFKSDDTPRTLGQKLIRLGMMVRNSDVVFKDGQDEKVVKHAYAAQCFAAAANKFLQEINNPNTHPNTRFDLKVSRGQLYLWAGHNVTVFDGIDIKERETLLKKEAYYRASINILEKLPADPSLQVQPLKKLFEQKIVDQLKIAHDQFDNVESQLNGQNNIF